MADNRDETDKFEGLANELAGDTPKSESNDEPTDEEPTGGAPALSDATEATAQEASKSVPPFSHNEVSLKGYYVQDETFEAVSEMRSVVRAVCSRHGLAEDELEARELHDAELSILQECEDWGTKVVMTILERRGIEADEEFIQEAIELFSD